MVLTETIEKKGKRWHHPGISTHSRWFRAKEVANHEIILISQERHGFVVPWQMDNDSEENSQLKIKF